MKTSIGILIILLCLVVGQFGCKTEQEGIKQNILNQECHKLINGQEGGEKLTLQNIRDFEGI